MSVQNGSTTVAGADVDFAASSRVGDSFVGPDGATYEVANVASATVISILPAYKGPTVSGEAYAIMPVQGYDKMLSDAFNSLNNQFGPKLAALGTTGNYDILPVEKGGTGNTNGTAQKLAAAGIVGTVSQAGGQPTGAIIERGSNANGQYVKFADGTMICTRTTTFTSTINALVGGQGSVYGSSGVPSAAMPATFIAIPAVEIDVTTSAAFTGWTGGKSPASISSWGTLMLLEAFARASQTYTIQYTAIGRWF
ncbi:phage tail protein [Pseudomonas grimontii]|uniref:phage tail protein n=1 Tax=Pseudomonas grimontii TaxID=129847 RepID=UPI001FC9B5BD|nr:phage tail protein [Pseudomonas grimontii]